MEVIKDNERLYSAIVNPEMAEALMTENTLVIIVDVSKPSLCAAPSIVKKANKLVIIDHHRRGENSLKILTWFILNRMLHLSVN